MNPVAGWLNAEVRVESTVGSSNDGFTRRYRLVGGRDDGGEFESLAALCVYARELEQEDGLSV